MANTFPGRIEQLKRRVGDGDLTGHVVVDQPYAQYQHERTDLRHPRGGGPNYLGGPLFTQSNDYLQRVADAVLDGDVENAMADAMESLTEEVASEAPVLTGRLRESGHPFVTSGETTVYDRPPIAGRYEHG